MTQPPDAPFGHARVFVDDGNCFDVILQTPWHQTVEFYLHHGMFTFLGGMIERAHVVRVHQVTVTGIVEDPAARVGVAGPQSVN